VGEAIDPSFRRRSNRDTRYAHVRGAAPDRWSNRSEPPLGKIGPGAEDRGKLRGRCRSRPELGLGFFTWRPAFLPSLRSALGGRFQLQLEQSTDGLGIRLSRLAKR